MKSTTSAKDVERKIRILQAQRNKLNEKIAKLQEKWAVSQDKILEGIKDYVKNRPPIVIDGKRVKEMYDANCSGTYLFFPGTYIPFAFCKESAPLVAFVEDYTDTHQSRFEFCDLDDNGECFDTYTL